MPFDDRRADARIQFRLMAASRILATVTILVAVLALIADIFGTPFAAWKGVWTVRQSEALGLLAAGAALWLLLPGRRPLWRTAAGCLFSLFVAVIGAAALIELLAYPGSALDRLLLDVIHPIAWGSDTSQMAPNTAFCLLAAGISLLSLNLRRRLSGWVVQLSALAAWLIALAALIGYLDGVRSLYVVRTYTGMSVLTGITLFALATGCLLARPGLGFIRHMSEGNPGSVLLRRLLPFVVVVPAMLGWARLQTEKVGLYNPGGSVVLFTVVDMFFFIVFILFAIAPLNAMLREVRRTSRQVEKEKSTLDAIMNAADHSIISVDLKGTIRTFNHAAERWLGYDAQEIIGRRTPIIFHDPKEVAERARELTVELQRSVEPGFEVFVARARQGLPEEHDWTYVRKDGSRFPVSLTVTAQYDAEGRIFGFLGIASDITGRLEVDRMKDEFCSTVSHELRTPLTSIRGSLALLEGGMAEGLSDESRSLVHIAYNNCERLIRLINDILDIQKMEAGRLDFDFRQLTLDAFLKESLAANREYASQYRVSLHLHNKVPGSRVNVDPDRLAQVMNNLLSNAAKFSPPDSTVEVVLDRGLLGVRLTVEDRGRGVPEAFRARIFERFVQVDASDRRHASGTGLGLSICKEIVEHMGGIIGYEPRPGGGSIFYVDLPLADSGGGS